MHDDLLAAYGPQSWWPAETPFDVILGAYLTQNMAWKAVERSLRTCVQQVLSQSKACGACTRRR